MERQQFVWSAVTHDFRGAGVYLGVAPQSEHDALAQLLTDRQLKVFTGATVRLREASVSPLTYYAVRDPSAVKVKPLDRPPLADGFRHVKLIFGPDRPGTARRATVVASACGPAPDSGPPAFLLTIGLSIPREEEFFQKVCCDHAEQTWGELSQRLKDMGRS